MVQTSPRSLATVSRVPLGSIAKRRRASASAESGNPGPSLKAEPRVRNRRLEGLLGLTVLLLMANNLGLPLTGGYLAIDVLMVAVGFNFARALREHADQEQRLKRFWLIELSPIVAPVAVAIVLATVYWGFLDQIADPQLRGVLGGLTMTYNLFSIFGGAEFAAIEHLWVIGVIVQFSLIAPLLVLGGRKHISADRRASALLGLGFGVALCRLGFLVTGSADDASIAINTLTRLDALLVGLVVGVAPLQTLRRRLPMGLAPPAFAMLLLLFVLAPAMSEMPKVVLGVMVAVTVALAGFVTAWSATGHADGALEATLDNQVLRWVGRRAISIYLWHQLFGLTLTADDLATSEDVQEWPGFAVFIVRVVFSLAAAATSYRYIELPAMAAARALLARTSQPGGKRRPGRRTTTGRPMNGPEVEAAQDRRPEDTGNPERTRQVQDRPLEERPMRRQHPTRATANPTANEPAHSPATSFRSLSTPPPSLLQA